MSSTDTLEGKPQPDAVPEGQTDQGDHEGHDHGPVLNPECTRELVLDVPAEEVSRTYGNVANNFRKLAKIPGFRAGKVPETVIRRRYATEIRKEVIDRLLPTRFNKAIREQDIRPVGEPRVTELTVEEGQPLHVKAIFEFIPPFSIEGYKDVTVEKPSAEVTEEEFAREMEELQESRATIEPVEEDRPLANGDLAQISYTGRIEGAAEGEAEPEPLKSEDTQVEIGGRNTVEAFSTALTGAKPGQELKAEVSYPADYPEPKLAGKTVAYEIQVKGIKKRNVPELNDDFAKELGEYENLPALENRVREHMATRKQRSVESETRKKLYDALAERFSFPVPESLIQDQIDTRLERGLRALAAQGMSTEQMRKMDLGRLRTGQRDGAVSEVKTSILLDRIADEEKVAVTDEEVDQELQLVALQSRENVETLRTRLTQDGGLARIREQLRREKTGNLLYERLPTAGQ